MSENKSGNKVNFLLGLFVGMAIISIIGFISLLAFAFSKDNSDDLAVKAEANNVVEDTTTGNENVLMAVPKIRDGEAFVGGENAPVEIVEYTDFECPYCAKHHATINQIIAAYGDKIKYTTRNYPLSFHPEAQKAAESFECASEQGQPFEMSDKLFALNTAGDMSLENFKLAAKELGLNTTQFNNCLDSGKYEQKVKSDLEEGMAVGVEGTPATFINGQLVSGALPFENFKSILDQLVK